MNQAGCKILLLPCRIGWADEDSQWACSMSIDRLVDVASNQASRLMARLAANFAAKLKNRRIGFLAGLNLVVFAADGRCTIHLNHAKGWRLTIDQK